MGRLTGIERIFDMSLNTAIWWTTMACNFKCRYCWEVQAQERGEFKPIPFIAAEKWLEAWRRLQPKLLDITGGEPFLLPGLLDVIAGVGPQTRCAITTNLSHPMLDLATRISPEQLIHITASFHPTQNGTQRHPMNPALFTGRLLFLKHRGFDVSVNIVAWPEHIWMLDRWKAHFEGLGVPVHIDPYSPISYYPWAPSPQEQAVIDRFATDNRKPRPELKGKTVRCTAGVSHISVQPDGSAWRCIYDTQNGILPLGNVFDPGFSLLPERGLCAAADRCGGCDRDKVQIEVVTQPL